MAGWRVVCGVVAVLALVATGCTDSSPPVPEHADAGRSTVAPPPPAGAVNLADLVERLSPSVVTVHTTGGLGSGVVLRPDVVVTNQHVVADEKQITVSIADGSRSPGTVLATDRFTDLAVVRTERKNLPVPQIRKELPRPGEPVLAIGSPLGFQNSVSAGIISGLHRAIPGAAAQTQSLVDLIQTDASISPGNSGGALFDNAGRLVGINEAYIPPSAGAVSIGFAIPSATMLDTTTQLLATGTAKHPYLGVSLGQLTPEIRRQLGVQTEQGALVMAVDKDGPAATAGIHPGDVVVGFGDKQVRSVDDMLGFLRGHDPGQQVGLTIVREGRQQQLTVTIGARDG